MAEALKSAPQAKRIMPKDFAATAAGFHNNIWSARLVGEMTIDDALEESFWAHVAGKIKAGDLIHIRNSENTIFAELYVRAVGPTWAKVVVLREAEFGSKVNVPPGSPFTIKWNVGKLRYDVMRVGDKEKVAGDFLDKESALAWINAHMVPSRAPGK